MTSGPVSSVLNTGSIRIAGHDLATDGDQARRALGVCTQDDTFDSDFTVRGNLEQTARYYRPKIEDLAARIDALLEQFGLTEFANHKPDTLSGGYKRRLMIALAVVHRPQVVFLDEPTTGLDPQARVGVWELVSQLRAAGMAVVLTTHYMDEAERLSDRLVLLQSGKVRASGTTRQPRPMCSSLTVSLQRGWVNRPGWGRTSWCRSLHSP